MSPVLFSAEITDFKILYNVLKAMSHQEFCIIRCQSEGIKITADDQKSTETSLYIQEEVFSSYNVLQDTKFKISLKILTECLHIYGDEGTPTLKMIYKSVGSPLCLVIKHSDENITVDCQLSTMDVEDLPDVNLSEECNVNNILLSGDKFVDVLSDLDMLADDIELVLSNAAPYFQMKTSSTTGESVVDISNHSEMVWTFQVKQDFKAKYAFSNIKQALKVMAYADKVSISTGDSGLLGMQILIMSNDRKLFVEYYITSLFEID